MEEKFLHAEEPEAERNSQFLTRKDSSNLLSVLFDASRAGTGMCAAEKLKSRKLIDQVFNEGKSVSVNGFTLVYLYTPLSVLYPAQAGFSVPKKHFTRAVDRNRIKRLMRECYRHQKAGLYQRLVANGSSAAFMFVYKGRSLPDFNITCSSLSQCISKIGVL